MFPLGTLARRSIAVADWRVSGPGMFTMLGGLLQAIHGITTLEDRTGIELLVTADEEVGSATSWALLEGRAQAYGAVLVLEGAAEDGALKVARKGCGTFTFTVSGRAAHAGLESHLGVDALVEAAHQVLEVAALNDAALGTTVTPTLAHAGTAENTVPAEATISVDVRMHTANDGARVDAALRALTPHLPGATITVHSAIN